MEIIITNESMQTGAMGAGKVLIVDDQGNIVNQLDDSQHSIHKFINSTAVMMGGSDGWMEIWDFVSDTRVTLPVPAGHHELDYNPITDTSMVLETATTGEVWDGLEVIYGSSNPQSVNPVFFVLAGIMVAIPVIVVISLIRTGRIKFSRE